MEFFIEKHSSMPVVSQIEEQIKFAVMMGIFRNGDTLPSIRDIEKQTGIHHSQIHKAYLNLRRSGLVVLTRGKGSVVSTAAESPKTINDNCLKLSQSVTSKARRMGISPTAFARYLSRYAQESERKTPFICYVDHHEEIAAQTAAEISQLWQVPVQGLTFTELKEAIAKSSSTPRILVNHILYELVRSFLSRKRSAVIPVKVRVSEQTIKLLAGIHPNASILYLHLPQPSHRLHFMMEQVKELMPAPDILIAASPINKISDLPKLLNSTEYDFYLIGPGVRGDVPSAMRQNPRIIQIDPQLDRTSLETARVRSGVVI